MTHGRGSKALALLAADASVEASATALELVVRLVSDGVALPRMGASMQVLGSRGVGEILKENVIAMRALG